MVNSLSGTSCQTDAQFDGHVGTMCGYAYYTIMRTVRVRAYNICVEYVRILKVCAYKNTCVQVMRTICTYIMCVQYVCTVCAYIICVHYVRTNIYEYIMRTVCLQYMRKEYGSSA